MKKYFTLLTFLVLSALCTTVFAQVKGHSYYALDTRFDNDLEADILLEVENEGSLALGQIKYKNQESAIKLYGRRDRKDPNVFHMEEHLDNGQWTGKIDLTIENGVAKSATWSNPLGDTSYEISFRRVLSFPYGEIRTFFRPASAENRAGHYINYIRNGKVFVNDRALNVMPNGPKDGFFTFEQSAKTLHTNTYSDLTSNEFTTSWGYQDTEVTYTMKFYEDFIDVEILMAYENAEQDLLQIEGFFIREKGVLEVTHNAYGDLFSVRGRLEDGVPSLIVSKRRLDNEKDTYGETMITKGGRYPLYNVQGRVKDMFIGDMGVDINPVLLLLLEDGRVQMLELLKFRSSSGQMAVSDPLPNIEDIKYFMPWDPTGIELAENEKEVLSDAEIIEAEGGDYDGEEWPMELYAIDSQGKAHAISLFYSNGDYMLNPKNSIDCEAYLGLFSDWGCHLFYDENGEHKDFLGTFWLIEEDKEKGVSLYGYRMNQQRSLGAEYDPCYEEGTFLLRHDSENYQDLYITPKTGLMFTPKGKEKKFTFMDGVG